MATQLFTLRDLSAALDRVGDRVKQAVSALAQEAAGQTARRAELAYPVGPEHWRKGRRVGGGTLRASVTRGLPRAFSITSGGTPVPSAVVRVLAPHVHFYEDGTGPRFDPTRRNAARGRAPAHGPIFVRIAIQERDQMLRAAQALLDQPREL